MRRFLALILVVAGAGLLSACNGGGKSFSIVAGSENTVLEPLVAAFCKRQGFACSFTYQGSLDIGLALGRPDGIDADAVWPASSVWIDLFDSGRRVKNATSIAQMPVILGVRMSKARALGWIGRDVLMADILAAVRRGDLRFLMTSATQSNSGASAYLAMLSGALGSGGLIGPGDLERADVRETVRTLLSGVERSSGSSGWLADLYVKSARDGAQFDAMWNYEAVLKETNDALRAQGSEPLYAIYPADGVAVADSPLGFVDRGDADKAKFFADLVAFLESDDSARRIAETGRRIPRNGAIAPKAEPAWNFDPERLVTAIRMPEPAVIRAALDLYQSTLRKPSLTALCLDYSGSMKGEGEAQLEQAMAFLLTPEKASAVLVQWSPEDRILVLPFDSTVRPSYQASGDPQAQRALLADVTALSAGGGTDMYACIRAALGRIRDTPGRDAYLPAIVVMTDGRSDGDADRFIPEWSRVTPHVPVFGITFGDADQSQLDRLAAATSARVFDGKGDLAGAFRAARGYN